MQSAVLPVVIGIPVLLWMLLRIILPAGPYNMDPCGKGTFFPHLITYSVFGYVQVALGVFGAVWAFDEGAKAPAGLLLAAAILALLFVGFMALFYEGYMVAMNVPPGKSNYTLSKYALVLSLGISSVLLLIVGGVLAAVEVAR